MPEKKPLSPFWDRFLPMIADEETPKRFTKSEYDFTKARMRRKMAKRSRRINRNKKGKRSLSRKGRRKT